MDIRGWLNRVSAPKNDAELIARIDGAVERVVQVANPRLRFVPRYRKRLAPAVLASLEHVKGLVRALPAAREASAAAWSGDPYMRAFFATANDLARTFNLAPDLRLHFDRYPATGEAYAVLGMEMTERHVLGVALEGDVLRSEVPRTTVSFGDHRVRICGCSEPELRSEIEWRMLDQLALEALGRAASDQSHRNKLEQERALLKTRLKLLENQGAGMRAAVGDEAPPQLDRTRLELQLEANAQALRKLTAGASSLEADLELLREVLTRPAEYLHVAHRRLRLDQLNVVVENPAQGGTDFDFEVARVPGNPPLTRAFTLVRFPRSELQASARLTDEAARLL